MYYGTELGEKFVYKIFNMLFVIELFELGFLRNFKCIFLEILYLFLFIVIYWDIRRRIFCFVYEFQTKFFNQFLRNICKNMYFCVMLYFEEVGCYNDLVFFSGKLFY